MHYNRKYTLNESFFESINNEEKSYILGFIMADGYHNPKKSCLTVRLALQDENHLNKITSAMESNKPIRRIISSAYSGKHYESCQISIDSVKLSNQLVKLGVNSDKTSTLKFPTYIPVKLMSHFLRGYFDGDGSVCWDEKRKKSHVTICSTHSFCKSLQKLLKNKFDIGSSIHQKKGTPKTYGQLQICGNQQIRFLLTWLYDGGNIYLERKFKKSNEVLNKISMLKPYAFKKSRKYELAFT